MTNRVYILALFSFISMLLFASLAEAQGAYYDRMMAAKAAGAEQSHSINSAAKTATTSPQQTRYESTITAIKTSSASQARLISTGGYAQTIQQPRKGYTVYTAPAIKSQQVSAYTTGATVSQASERILGQYKSMETPSARLYQGTTYGIERTLTRAPIRSERSSAYGGAFRY